MQVNYVKDISIVSAAAVIFLAVSWIGFYGGDDWQYSEAARQWLSEGLFLGETHWSVRHTHVLPIAASYAIFGLGEFQLLLPSLVFYFASLIIIYALLNKFIGREAALISCLILSSTPILVFITTMTRPDITEAFFVLLSVWFFWNAPHSAVQNRMLFVAGLAAGLAWMTRETSVSLLLVFGLLFLAGRRINRNYYWIMAAGFFAILAIDALYSTLMDGNPFYRYITIISSHGAQLSKNVGYQISLLGVGETASSAAGNISLHWSIDPLIAILANQEFGLLFWFSIPAGLWLCFSRKIDPGHRELAQFFSLLALVWFVTVSYGLGLREQPRYFTIPSIASAVLIGIAFTESAIVISRAGRIALISLLILVNLFCFYIDNDDPLYEERAAVRLAGEMAEPIYTNANSALMGNRLLQIKQLPGVVSDELPPPGAIYFYVPCKEENIPCNTLKQPDKNPEFEPEKLRSEWTPVWRDDPGRKLSGILIEKLNLKQFVPASIYYKLDYPSLPVTAYRLPGAKTDAPDILNQNSHMRSQ